jgi:outer membrane protein assembly factor BamB
MRITECGVKIEKRRLFNRFRNPSHVNFATIWKRDVGDTVLGLSHLIGRRGVVVASRRILRTYDLDGEMRWRQGLKSDFRDVAPLSDGGMVVACKEALTFLNSDGDEKEEIPLDSEPVQVLAGEKVDLLGGNELQTFNLDWEPLGKVQLEVKAEAIIRHGSQFIVATEDSIIEVNSEGTVQWDRRFDQGISSLASAGDRIYLASGREVHALDSKGESLWSENFPNHVRQIDSNGVILVVLEGEAVLIDPGTHGTVSRIERGFSLGQISDNTAVFVSGKSVEFFEDVGDMDVYYEIMCRGERKCGTFVSSEFVNQCPKCGASKIILRVEKKRLDEKGLP